MGQKNVIFWWSFNLGSTFSWFELYDKLLGCCILEEISQKEKVCCIGFWALPTIEGLNLLKENEISVPQSDIIWLKFAI